MAVLANTFEGQSDPTTMTAANSGGGSGDAFDFVSASVVQFDSGITLHGTNTALISVASAAGLMSWLGSWTASTTTYARMYFRVSDATPTNHTIIMGFYESDDTTSGCDVQLRQTGVIGLRAPSTLRYSSTTVIDPDTWYRLEVKVVSSTTVGHMQARLFHGANLEGTTPDEEFGSATDNWDTGPSCGGVIFGLTSNPGQTMTMSVDDLSISDADWLGSSNPADTPLDTPVVTVTDESDPTTVSGTDGSITVTWPAVSGAVTYDAGIADGLDQTGGFTTDSSAATSPYTFTGLSAGDYTVAIRAVP